MAIIDALSEQLKSSMTMFGEHSYKESSDFPAKDPEGNVLPHRHTTPKAYDEKELNSQLYPYQKEFVDHDGLRDFNSLERYLHEGN